MQEHVHTIDDNWILAPLSGRMSAFQFGAVFAQHLADMRYPEEAHVKLFASFFERVDEVGRKNGISLLQRAPFACPAFFCCAMNLLPGLEEELGLCAVGCCSDTP